MTYRSDRQLVIVAFIFNLNVFFNSILHSIHVQLCAGHFCSLWKFNVSSYFKFTWRKHHLLNAILLCIHGVIIMLMNWLINLLRCLCELPVSASLNWLVLGTWTTEKSNRPRVDRINTWVTGKHSGIFADWSTRLSDDC